MSRVWHSEFFDVDVDGDVALAPKRRSLAAPRPQWFEENVELPPMAQSRSSRTDLAMQNITHKYSD